MALAQRIIRTIGQVIAGILVISIVLVFADANEDNGLVAAILDVGRFFAEPFRGIFELDDNTLQIAINWGIGAVVYVVVTVVLASLVGNLSRRGSGSRTTGSA